ncbi:hypothetical protein SKAU_G00151620 [Synaphobranchus kaupii]|uniref:Uncharacterized protein n=1 Tax=Synaphobranchus kaupii TaxID=118154 RepID=A0A9Q1IZ09_SYNKA|nr:hypothetical protein SKAU_G00151620 [Synaphobranchus kaupii]
MENASRTTDASPHCSSNRIDGPRGHVSDPEAWRFYLCELDPGWARTRVRPGRPRFPRASRFSPTDR